MKELTKQFLNLLFNADETICISHNKYGYHSIKQEDVNNKDICLISPNEEVPPTYIKESDINLVAINPINGFRQDCNVTAFRSFLIEIDEGPLKEQKQYIEDIGLPYSICIFSGNKSLHYGVVLDKDLINIDFWRIVCQWILNIVKKADQATKNPSRNIRMPGNKRKNGKKLIQGLVDIRGRISHDDLNIWLNKFPDCKPINESHSYSTSYQFSPSLHTLPKYIYEILDRLQTRTQPNRNISWFHIACIMAGRRIELEEIIDYLEDYFIEEIDFKKREWLNTIKSGYKRGCK